MSVYYNELDPQKAAWLRELMRRNLIAPGEVDERSIEAVQPEDLTGFAQCHFFAGIGVWSYALRNAGWSDSSPVWTGSCPCPSFSQSGKGLGFDDPRHLWPAWFRLVRVCRPHAVFGEQVASVAGLAWLDVVSSDLEGADYAIGSADLCAAGIGAPHIRQRLYFVADTERKRTGRHAGNGAGSQGASGGPRRPDGHNASNLPFTCGTTRVVEYSSSDRYARGTGEAGAESIGEPSRSAEQRSGAADVVGDSSSERCGEEGRSGGRSTQRIGHASKPRELGDTDCKLEASLETIPDRPLPPTTRSWADVEWLPCRDGKARPVESGTFPLAHGIPARVVRLRGYGDAIVAPLAQAFIEAYVQVRYIA